MGEILYISVLRKGHGYHDKRFTEQYASASGIRQALFFHGLDISNGIIKSLPDSTLRIMKREIESNRTPVFLQDYETIILYVLRRMQPRELTAYFDVEEALKPY